MVNGQSPYCVRSEPYCSVAHHWTPYVLREICTEMTGNEGGSPWYGTAARPACWSPNLTSDGDPAGDILHVVHIGHYDHGPGPGRVLPPQAEPAIVEAQPRRPAIVHWLRIEAGRHDLRRHGRVVVVRRVDAMPGRHDDDAHRWRGLALAAGVGNHARFERKRISRDRETEVRYSVWQPAKLGVTHHRIERGRRLLRHWPVRWRRLRRGADWSRLRGRSGPAIDHHPEYPG